MNRRVTSRFMVLIVLSSTILLSNFQPALAEEAAQAEATDAEEIDKEELGNLLGEALKKLFARPERVARPMLVPAVMQPPQAKEANRERITSFLKAHAAWIDRTCRLTQEQREALARFQEEAIEREMQEFDAHAQQRQNVALPTYSPISLTTQGAAARLLRDQKWIRQIRDLLTDEQQTLFDEAMEQREFRAKRASAMNFFALLDEELFFHSSQRDSISQQILDEVQARPYCLMSLSGQTYYIDYQTPPRLLERLDNQDLTTAQQSLFAKIKQNIRNQGSNQRYLTFMSNDGVESWYTSLDNSIAEQEQFLSAAVEIRIDFISAECDMTAAQIRHLRTASKGTLLYCIRDWQESSTKQLRDWEERMQQDQFRFGNFGFSISLPQPEVIDRHPLWKATLNEVAGKAQTAFQQREELHREIRRDYILSLLDMELWLSPDQLEKLSVQLTPKVPVGELPNREYFHEIILLSVPYVRLSDHEVQEILDESQLQAWKTLGSQFQINGQNVTITMNHGGQFGFHVPR